MPAPVVSNSLYFSYARSAFKYALIGLGLRSGARILIPDFICDVVLHPLKQLGMEWDYYPINDDLSPRWDDLEQKLSRGCDAILMVHYFGRPQDIDRFVLLSRRYGVHLIEDNAHGFGGMYAGQLLGTLGDAGIASPRKMLGLPHGGILYWNNNRIPSPLVNLPVAPEMVSGRILKFARRIPGLKRLFHFLTRRQPHYWDPQAFPEPEEPDMILNETTIQLIKSVDLETLRKARMSQYFVWEERCKKWGLEPVFGSIPEGMSPLCYPVYLQESRERKQWFDWGWKNGIDVHSWPTLPIDQLAPPREAFRRWERLVCFPIGFPVG